MAAGQVVPGLRPERLRRLVTQVVDELSLDLSGRRVVTEAATGAYAVTPVLAAYAGAQVVAVTRATRYGSVAQVVAQTSRLANLLGVQRAVTVTDRLVDDHLSSADVVTNSGHLRPLDARLISQLRPGAVVPLMFEAWELDGHRADVDVAALRARGIRFAGTNERHPQIGVFDYLGAMAAATLVDAGYPVLGTRVALVCDNAFAPFIAKGLGDAGATAGVFGSDRELVDFATTVPERDKPDVVLVAMQPTGSPVLSSRALAALGRALPDVCVVQYWGDLDRDSTAAPGLAFWPPEAPSAGHMAVLPSRVGPDPVVRLQAGGLKVAEVLLKDPQLRTPSDREYLDEL